MPAMSGFELAEQIKKNSDLHDTTILMLTSAGSGDDVARCRKLGIQAYLTKPVKSSDLLESIQQVLSDSPWQPHLQERRAGTFAQLTRNHNSLTDSPVSLRCRARNGVNARSVTQHHTSFAHLDRSIKVQASVLSTKRFSYNSHRTKTLPCSSGAH
jgi:DNA-binding response OmpR family regulator